MFKVKCIDSKNTWGRLGDGTTYEVLRCTLGEMYELRDDSGAVGEWLRSRFRTLETVP